MNQNVNRIRVELDRAGKSQLWLSQQVVLSTNTISSFCRNESQPKLDDLYRIAEALQIDVIKLLVPNDYAKRIKRLSVPTGLFEAQLLNGILTQMIEKDGVTSNGYFYYNSLQVDLRSDIKSPEIFNVLVQILRQDDLVYLSTTGALVFTPRGMILAEEFNRNKNNPSTYIGYEARRREIEYMVENTSY